MVAFNDSMDSPLTLMQIEELRRALDKNGDGFISYREFFDGLAIVDDKSLNPPVDGESRPNPLVRKSSSFYFQQLERDERLGKIIASKKAAKGVQSQSSSSSVASPTSSSESDDDDVSGVVDDDQLV